MEITERHELGAIIGQLNGKLDAQSVPEFEQWFDDRTAAGHSTFVLDFGGVSYLSSAGMRAVLSANRELSAPPGRLLICGLYGMARQVFQVSGILKVLLVYHDLGEALAALGQAPD